MPITLLINRLIEVATLHANELGIGFATLSAHGHTWVLSRVAVDVVRYPRVNDTYTVRTWICSMSRLFSERDFEICTADGRPVGYARTVWAALDVNTRTVADISYLQEAGDMAAQRECPVEKPSRPVALKEYTSVPYTFKYTDIDFNRHVNSSRYIELLLNQWSLDFHDRHRLCRFEIAYLHEAYFGETIDVRLCDTPEGVRAELAAPDRPLCRALLRFMPVD